MQMNKTGLTHVYYGYGKGKTTAALGLALRASGNGMRVVIVQFLKNADTSELKQLARLPEITVLRGKPGPLFGRAMSDEQKKEILKRHNENLTDAIALVREGICDMLILDEVLDAYQMELVDKGALLDLIRNKPQALELVITGHKESPEIMELAEYVTEMVKRKHPFDAGIKARKGIEY